MSQKYLSHACVHMPYVVNSGEGEGRGGVMGY